MKIIDCEQGSPEWYKARLGVPTASEFDKIVTGTGKASAQADAYRLKLIAERLTGDFDEGFKNSYMDRGKELEAEAAEFYEITTGQTLTKVGFCTDDTGSYGASPDRLVGEDGILEIKVPGAHTHVGYMLYGFGNEYKHQRQGQMLVCDKRRYVDLMSYHPKMPPVIVRIERDESYIMSQKMGLATFNKKLNEDFEEVKRKYKLIA